MLTDMQRLFVEVAARTIRETLAERDRSETCIVRVSSDPAFCGRSKAHACHAPSDSASEPPGPPALPSARRHSFRNVLGPAEQQTAYPYARDVAIYLLGRVEGENRSRIEEIVAAAREVWERERTGAFTDDARLFRAITLEALGQGKVSERFGEIRVLPHPALSHYEPLSIPSLEETQTEGES